MQNVYIIVSTGIMLLAGWFLQDPPITTDGSMAALPYTISAISKVSEHICGYALHSPDTTGLWEYQPDDPGPSHVLRILSKKASLSRDKLQIELSWG